MRHVIIGTAGHVDHGKSALIRALTSRDPDRLAEEKARGITVDIGFAWLDLPDKTKAGIIDVPGHERFIGNMLAGAGGIDVALLVVAADEGVMPQTFEHIGILHLLGVRKGVIALSRCDLADEELAALAEDDIRQRTKGTFLEQAPIIHTSAVTGQGVEELRQALVNAVTDMQSCPSDRENRPFRMPVDRVFSVDGFGTIVTGTVIEGNVKTGGSVTIFPGSRNVRIRNIQIHESASERADAGQRAALNLSGIHKSDLSRGFILAEKESLFSSTRLDVLLKALCKTKFPIKNNMRVHLYHHTKTVLARVVLLDRDTLEAGGFATAQLRLEEPVFTRYGDRFIIRFYSPQETIGGGIITDPLPSRRKRFNPANEDVFFVMKGKDPAQRLKQTIAAGSASFEPLSIAGYRAGIFKRQRDPLLKSLCDSGDIVLLDDNTAVSPARIAALGHNAEIILHRFYQERPLDTGMKREEMRTRLLPRAGIRLSDKVIDILSGNNIIEIRDGLIALPGHCVSISEEDRKALSEIETLYLHHCFSPPSTDDVLSKEKQPSKTEQHIRVLLNRGTLVLLTPQIIMHKDAVDKALSIVRETIKRDGSLALADFRDRLGTSRRYAAALLEFFDKMKETRMKGDVRVRYSAPRNNES